jgi:hypothetical protein
MQICLIFIRRYFSLYLYLLSLSSLPSLLQFYLPYTLSTPIVKYILPFNLLLLSYYNRSTLSYCTYGDSTHFLSVDRNVVPDCRHSSMTAEHFIDSIRYRGNILFIYYRSFNTYYIRDDCAFLVISLPFRTFLLL